MLVMPVERLFHREIAGRLFVSRDTVKKPTANLYRKLNDQCRGSRCELGRRLNPV
jgi:DNA-binding CsgD family transcriptional regulator